MNTWNFANWIYRIYICTSITFPIIFPENNAAIESTLKTLSNCNNRWHETAIKLFSIQFAVLSDVVFLDRYIDKLYMSKLYTQNIQSANVFANQLNSSEVSLISVMIADNEKITSSEVPKCAWNSMEQWTHFWLWYVTLWRDGHSVIVHMWLGQG